MVQILPSWGFSVPEQWVRDGLDAWIRCGAKRFVTLRELATASGLRLAASESADGCELAVEGAPADGVERTLPASCCPDGECRRGSF
jgi:hypothetical protein